MSSKRNSESPWNPAKSISITPEEYEKQVVKWLEKAESSKLVDFEVNHRKMLSGSSGDYEIDAVAEFTIFDGVNLKVIVECKRYSNPVPRDLVLTFWAKIQETSANKGMLFSTSGFQSGALDFTTSKNIATITFVDGAFTYKTKSMNTKAKPPPWFEKHNYCGLFVEKNGTNISSARIDNSRLDELSEWLKTGV